MTKKKARRALKQSLMNLYWSVYGAQFGGVTRRQSNGEFKTLWARARAYTR